MESNILVLEMGLLFEIQVTVYQKF